jgi:urocanate reductase
MPTERYEPAKQLDREPSSAPGIGRRDFLKRGVAVGAGAVALGGVAPRADASVGGIEWDLEADVVVIGSGATGLPAAVSAADHGASVIIVEQHFDVGGRAIISAGGVGIGGGNQFQIDNGIEDTPDMIFDDWTRPDHPESVFSDRVLIRAFADECVPTYDFLIENGVTFSSIWGPVTADRVSRRPVTRIWPNRDEEVRRGAAGSGLIRPLERSARSKGVQILLTQRMTRIYRETPASGRVLGIAVEEVDEMYRPTGRTMNIHAKKGVIIGTGGSTSNVNFRRIFDPRLTEEYQAHGHELTPQNADGEIAAMAIGAILWATANQTSNGLFSGGHTVRRGNLGCRDNYTTTAGWDVQNSPLAGRMRASGFRVQDPQNLILVKENGLRFYDEMADERDSGYLNAAFAWSGDRNRLDGGGPIWAIFDADAVEREQWTLAPPYIDPDFFFSGDTLEELARKIIQNPYQWRPMPPEVLRATVERYNSFVDSGVDIDFGKAAPEFKIQRPPFHAAWGTPILHDCNVGLRINEKAQVVDLKGEVIPGLYCAGESAGGFAKHGLAKGVVMGRVAGRDAALSDVAG